MDRVSNVESSPKYHPQKKTYEKPKVTTFGPVAKLTMGSSGSRTDFLGTRTHGNGHHGHGH